MDQTVTQPRSDRLAPAPARPQPPAAAPGARAPSLARLLLVQHATLLSLLIITALLGAVWIGALREAASASLDLARLRASAQQAHLDIYRQAQNVIAAARAGGEQSAARYWSLAYRTEARLEALEQELEAQGYDEAITSMRDAYALMQADVNVVLTDDERDPHLLVERALERWVSNAFSDAYLALAERLDQEQQQVTEDLDRLKRQAAWLLPLPFVASLLLVLHIHRRLGRVFAAPMRALTEGATAIARGHLDHRIERQGVAETQAVAAAINSMAGDLERTRAELLEHERQASLARLIPIVAHNIRNPLASIRAVAEAADESDGAEDRAEARRAIMTTVDRLEQWTSQLLGYLNPFEPELEACVPEELLAAVLELTDSQARERDIRLVQRPDGVQDVVPLDRRLVEQALHGLLVNALEASPDGARVETASRCAGPWLELVVDDAGSGLPAAIVAGDLPSPMRRQRAATPDAGSRPPRGDAAAARARDDTGTTPSPGPTTKTHGTGIGIPFAQKVADAHGGELRYERNERGGTRALLRLPRVRGARQLEHDTGAR